MIRDSKDKAKIIILRLSQLLDVVMSIIVYAIERTKAGRTLVNIHLRCFLLATFLLIELNSLSLRYEKAKR
jgi:hypothetical protein